MSRIAGIKKRLGSRVQHVDRMLARTTSPLSWNRLIVSERDVKLGWTGWQTASICQIGGISAVVDGCFFRCDEPGHDTDDARKLIELYRRHGFTGGLKRINGDFAVALYDSSDDTLWLGRDRIGIKPLYYVRNGDQFAFASRSTALLDLPDISHEPNRRFVATFAASHYRYFDNKPESSPFADIAQLPAAHVLRFKNGEIEKTRYWELTEQPDWTESEQELAKRYRDLLLDAVSIRLRKANRPVFTLSGGMDSSSVLSSAVQTTGVKQHAVSTIYEDKTYDESEDIQTILDETVQQWHPILLDNSPNVMEIVERMVAVHDEPVATATWLSHYLLCEQVADKGFGSLFGGLGGDELNAGEYEYFWFHFADLRAAGEEQQLGHEIDQWIRYHDHPIFRKSHELVENLLPNLVDFSRPGICQPDKTRMTRYCSTLDRDFFDLDSLIPRMDHPFQSYLKNRTYQDIFRETAPCCLRAEDRQSMAFGLENFLPFFDHRLVEFMFRVPGKYKIRDGVTKRLLREATRGILPDETRNRIVKTGWNAPAHQWFFGKNAEPLQDMIRSQAFRERGIYNVAEVQRLFDDHQQVIETGTNRENHMMFFWQLVNLETWLASDAFTQPRVSASAA